MKNLSAALASAVVAASLSVIPQSAMAQDTLVFASQSPGGSNNNNFYGEWAKRVTDQAKGAVKVDLRVGETIANFINSYDRVTSDIIQIGWIIPGLVGGRFPLSDVASLPFIADDNVACSAALAKLYDSGLLDDEFKDIMPLWFGCLTPSYLHWGKEPASLDDLSGQKVRVNGKVPGQVVQLLGGAPISLTGGEMYEAVKRGTIDAIATSWPGFAPYKLVEVTNFHLEVPLGVTPSFHFMSRAKFKSLSKAAQDVILANAGEARSREMGAFIVGEGNRAREGVVAAGQKIVKLAPEKLADWKKRTDAVVADWAKSRNNGDKAVAMFTKAYNDALAAK